MHIELEQILKEVIEGKDGSWEKFLNRRRELGAQAKWDEPEACSNLELLTYLQHHDLKHLPLPAYSFFIDILSSFSNVHQELKLTYRTIFQKISSTSPHLLKRIMAYIIAVSLSNDILKKPYRDSTEESNWYTKCLQLEDEIKSEDGTTHLLLGSMYRFGIGVPIDHANAAECYSKAAAKGNAEAQYQLGVLYRAGQGVNQDDTQAVRWFQEAADQGNAMAQNNLGTHYFFGKGVLKDEAEAATYWRKTAEQGLAQGQYGLSIYLRQKTNDPQSELESIAWFRKAAEQGYDKAEYELGEIYFKGKGIPKDETEAMRWFRKAADQGLAKAEYALSVCLSQKTNDPKSAAEALAWLEKAAKQQWANAEYNLGVHYLKGDGVRKDEVEAMGWIRKAAEHGSEQARDYLKSKQMPPPGAFIFAKPVASSASVSSQEGHFSRTPSKNPPLTEQELQLRKNIDTIKLAAVEGNIAAQEELSRLYEEGKGVERSPRLAAKWKHSAENARWKAQKSDSKIATPNPACLPPSAPILQPAAAGNKHQLQTEEKNTTKAQRLASIENESTEVLTEKTEIPTLHFY